MSEADRKLIERLRKQADQLGLLLSDPPKPAPSAIYMREAADRIEQLLNDGEVLAGEWTKIKSSVEQLITERERLREALSLIRDNNAPAGDREAAMRHIANMRADARTALQETSQ